MVRSEHQIDGLAVFRLEAVPSTVLLVASVVISGKSRTCAEADAWATALMVLGPDRGAALARRCGLDALFLLRDDDASARGVGVGRLFSEEPAAIASAEGR
jgi:thiamine biosynthesis lipoprotein